MQCWMFILKTLIKSKPAFVLNSQVNALSACQNILRIGISTTLE